MCCHTIDFHCKEIYSTEILFFTQQLCDICKPKYTCHHAHTLMLPCTHIVSIRRISPTNFAPALCLKQYSHCSLMCPKKGIIAGEQGTIPKIKNQSVKRRETEGVWLEDGYWLAMHFNLSSLAKRNKLVSKACILCQIYKDAQSYGIKSDMQVAQTDFRSKAEVVICSHKSPEL